MYVLQPQHVAADATFEAPLQLLHTYKEAVCGVGSSRAAAQPQAHNNAAAAAGEAEDEAVASIMALLPKK